MGPLLKEVQLVFQWWCPCTCRHAYFQYILHSLTFTCIPVSGVDEPLVVLDSDSDPEINWWIEAFGLHESDKEISLLQRDFTDNITNAAQILLRAQFPSIGGFQNTLLGNKLQFNPISRDISSIQIHHTGINFLNLYGISLNEYVVRNNYR